MTSERAIAARVASLFPAVRRTLAGRSVAYFDGPGGTQVPQCVVDAMSDYLLNHNANDGWAYATSVETDRALSSVRAAVATFVRAASTDEIIFGANMTTLTFHLARAVGRMLRPGDEIVVTDLDHHADIDPWVALVRDYGAVIKRVPLRDGRPHLDLDAYRALLGPRTRLVAIGLSSNAFGTINPVAEMARAAHERGSLVFVDAVHAAAHASLDVDLLGADMLTFSAYKVYGPHVGVAYCREAVFSRLDVPKLAPQSSLGSKRAESGTLNHEGIVGMGAALEFLAALGATPANGSQASLRDRFTSAFAALEREESAVFDILLAGLRDLPHVTLYEPPRGVPRHPTIAFAVRDVDAATVAATLSRDDGIFVSHGNFYAATAVERVAPETLASGGLVRAGVALYTTADDARRLVAAVAALR